MNAIESPELRSIFLMLRDDLEDRDIPKRTTLSRRLDEVFEEHLVQLEQDITVTFTYNIFNNILTNDNNRNLVEKFPLQWICGQIQT